MKVQMLKWSKDSNWKYEGDKTEPNKDSQLVIYFGAPGTLDSGERFNELKSMYPNAHIMGCSTSGEIAGAEVFDDTIVATAILFEKSTIETVSETVKDNTESHKAGASIAEKLKKKSGLRHIFLLSDGLNVNGSELVKGVIENVPSDVTVTGGLAGDGTNFSKTVAGLDEVPTSHKIAAVGFYGDGINIGFGGVGGWDPFGPERVVTRSKDNILYELDGQPALDLYKKYLGEEAEKLPGSALFFPFSMRPAESSAKDTIIRTILNTDDNEKSVTCAGDIPEGSIVRLMKGNFEHLIDGAAKAAKLTGSNDDKDSCALLVNCVGRKVVLGQEADSETEAIAKVLGKTVPTIGFYSYGEICHHEVTKECLLHNQTMTVTLLNETM